MTTVNKINKVSIIIPTFNEEKAIEQILSGLIQLYPDFEIIVIDDGSADNTCNLIEDLDTKVIHHSYNKGYGA